MFELFFKPCHIYLCDTTSYKYDVVSHRYNQNGEKKFILYNFILCNSNENPNKNLRD